MSHFTSEFPRENRQPLRLKMKWTVIGEVCVFMLVLSAGFARRTVDLEDFRRLGEMMEDASQSRQLMDCCDSVVSAGCSCSDDPASPYGKMAFCVSTATIPTCAAEQNVSLVLYNTTVSSLSVDAFTTWTGSLIAVIWAVSTPVTLVDNVFRNQPNLQGLQLQNVQGTIPSGVIGPGLTSLQIVVLFSPTDPIPGCFLRNAPTVNLVALGSPSLGGGLLSHHPVELQEVIMVQSSAVLSPTVFDAVFANCNGYGLLNITDGSQDNVCCGFESAFKSRYPLAIFDLGNGTCLSDTDPRCVSALPGTPFCTEPYSDSFKCSASNGNPGSSASSSTLY